MALEDFAGAQGMRAGAGECVRRAGFTGARARSGVFLVHVSRPANWAARMQERAVPAASVAQKADAITADAGASCDRDYREQRTRMDGAEPGLAGWLDVGVDSGRFGEDGI